MYMFGSCLYVCMHVRGDNHTSSNENAYISLKQNIFCEVVCCIISVCAAALSLSLSEDDARLHATATVWQISGRFSFLPLGDLIFPSASLSLQFIL